MRPVVPMPQGNNMYRMKVEQGKGGALPLVIQNQQEQQVPQTGVNVIKVPTPKTKKEIEEEAYRKEVKEIIEATRVEINNMVANQQRIIEAMQVMQINHQRVIETMQANHEKEKEEIRREMRQILNEVMENNRGQMERMARNTEIIIENHNRNTIEIGAVIGRIERIYERTEAEREREIEEQIEEIKTKVEIGVQGVARTTQEAVNGAIQTLGEQVRAAVTIPITNKERYNTSGSQIIGREDAEILTVEQLNELITKIGKNEYTYKKRQETGPNDQRRRAIEIMRINKEMLKEVREEKKRLR